MKRTRCAEEDGELGLVRNKVRAVAQDAEAAQPSLAPLGCLAELGRRERRELKRHVAQRKADAAWLVGLLNSKKTRSLSSGLWTRSARTAQTRTSK